MRAARLSVGDEVVLKERLERRNNPDKVCRVVAVLPDSNGEAQYRVRFGSENFERRIVGSDIDLLHSESAAALPDAVPGARKAEPWLKPSTIRTGR